MEPQEQQKEVPGSKLFVGGVSWSTTDAAFKEFFAAFGEVTDAVIMRNMDGRSRGFGFVTFTNEGDAQKVISSENRELDGRMLDCKIAVPKDQMAPPARKQHQRMNNFRTCKIFVGGVSPETTKEDFEAYFGKFGKITDAIIMTDRDSGRSRGFGFVTFDSEEAVEACLAVPSHTISEKQVDCKKAVPKQSQPRGGGGYGHQGGYNNGYGGPQVGYAGGFNGGFQQQSYGRNNMNGGFNGGYGGGYQQQGYGGQAGFDQHGYDERHGGYDQSGYGGYNGGRGGGAGSQGWQGYGMGGQGAGYAQGQNGGGNYGPANPAQRNQGYHGYNESGNGYLGAPGSPPGAQLGGLGYPQQGFGSPVLEGQRGPGGQGYGNNGGII